MMEGEGGNLRRHWLVAERTQLRRLNWVDYVEERALERLEDSAPVSLDTSLSVFSKHLVCQFDDLTASVSRGVGGSFTLRLPRNAGVYENQPTRLAEGRGSYS